VPFTPFHFGPGALVKAVAPKYFSFTVFVFSQVLIDLEPLYFILTDGWPLHRFFHTYLGACLIALASFVIGRPVCGLVLGMLRRPVKMVSISPIAAASGAVIGAFSHVALDSVMHSDMRPFAPFADENALLHIISIGELHVYCAVAGLLGAVGLGLWWLVWKDRRKV
jgi:membrane-bound metal-dependent hydrolase YbcI (DUF457 family)